MVGPGEAEISCSAEGGCMRYGGCSAASPSTMRLAYVARSWSGSPDWLRRTAACVTVRTT